MTTLYAGARATPAAPDEQFSVARAKVSPWVWMAITCLLLGVSGGIRFWRDYQFRTLAKEYANCPFPLKELPREFGTWRAIDGSDTQLDPLIARMAGSSDHLVRSYFDEKSGERVIALILYGPAISVYGHVPEICYPSAGYAPLRQPKDRAFVLADGKTEGQHRSAYYVRRVGATTECTEVYHSFLYDGHWLGNVADRWKSFRYHPGLFKVQLERQLPGIPSEENSDDDHVTESLFRAITSEISKMTHETDRTAPAAAEPVAQKAPVSGGVAAR
jgi:hypothetical protein